MTIFSNGVDKANYGFIITIQFLNDQNVAIDVSAATTKQIVFVDPSGTATAKTATFTTDGTDGKIQYVVDSVLFIAPVGQWSFYGVTKTATTFNKSTEQGSVLVALVPTL